MVIRVSPLSGSPYRFVKIGIHKQKKDTQAVEILLKNIVEKSPFPMHELNVTSPFTFPRTRRHAKSYCNTVQKTTYRYPYGR